VATIDPGATGSLTNTAIVTAPSGVIDTNPANNSATDTDTLRSPAVFFGFRPVGDVQCHCYVDVHAVALTPNTPYTGSVLLNGQVTFPLALTTDNEGDG